MKAVAQHPFRFFLRLGWLGAELMVAAGGCLVRCDRGAGETKARARAEWLQWASRRVLRVLGVTPRVVGPIPTAGLLVCNHLSYLDILVLAACTPCAFVAKQEVRNWPVFGWFARRAGTIFVARDKRLPAAAANQEIEAALQTGVVVVIFPEGTSSGGDTVLPFKSALLAPILRRPQTLTASRLAYELSEGDVSVEVCYWRDMTLAPHLLNLLGKPVIRAAVKFQPVPVVAQDRKELARALHAQVMALQPNAGG
jgi:lyso-ornithine lipid O-acyltransferase